MDRYDYETLKDCLGSKAWADEQDTVQTVGNILRNDYVINSVEQAFDYFGKPWRFEPEIKEAVVAFEIEHCLKDMARMNLKDAALALNWMEAFGFEQDAVDQLEEDWQENHQEELCVAKS